MANLPWDLWLNPVDLPDGLSATHEYDAASGRLTVTVTNRSESTLKPGDVRLWAEMDEPASDGWAWLQGRYMQTDALVRNFGAAPEEGYDGRYVRSVEGGRRYVSREAGTVTLLSQGSPALLAGCLRMDRFFFDFEVELNEDESRVRGIGVVVPVVVGFLTFAVVGIAGLGFLAYSLWPESPPPSETRDH